MSLVCEINKKEKSLLIRSGLDEVKISNARVSSYQRWSFSYDLSFFDSTYMMSPFHKTVVKDSTNLNDLKDALEDIRCYSLKDCVTLDNPFADTLVGRIDNCSGASNVDAFCIRAINKKGDWDNSDLTLEIMNFNATASDFSVDLKIELSDIEILEKVISKFMNFIRYELAQNFLNEKNFYKDNKEIYTIKNGNILKFKLRDGSFTLCKVGDEVEIYEIESKKDPTNRHHIRKGAITDIDKNFLYLKRYPTDSSSVLINLEDIAGIYHTRYDYIDDAPLEESEIGEMFLNSRAENFISDYCNVLEEIKDDFKTLNLNILCKKYKNTIRDLYLDEFTFSPLEAKKENEIIKKIKNKLFGKEEF